MMGWGYNPAWMMGGAWPQFVGVFNLITWVLFIIFLIAVIRWVWKKGDKK